MAPHTREEFVERLENDWRQYPVRFAQLSPAEQAAFLEKQGYPRLGVLLAHVAAWWRDGGEQIAQMRGNPALPLADYDVDAFNARAIQWALPLPEADLLENYERQRQAILALVGSLSAAEFAQENINTRLYYEILMHWTEHTI